MEPLIYVLIAVVCVAVAVGIYMFFRKKQTTTNLIQDSADSDLMVTSSNQMKVSGNEKGMELLLIQMEQLPMESIPDESALVEIKDSKVLARIDNLIPGIAQARTAAANAVRAGGETVYRAIIPAGAKLTDSKAMEEAVRGFYRGADGIQGHANLVAVNQTASQMANTVAVAMGVASMVVGQYYMTQINAELGEIHDDIEKIADFQDNEYKSKVFALVAQVKKIASFQVEILDNEELRMGEIAHLNELEDECIRLLGQANLTVASFADKKYSDYDAYKKNLHEAQNWYMYQHMLLDILYKISDLKYALHFGNVSREQCTALLPTYTKQVSDAQMKLADWHEGAVKRLGIDTSKATRKREGFDGVIHWIPGLFNDELNYRSISERTAEMIEMQSSEGVSSHLPGKEELYNEDIQIISKDGKLYYLPPTSDTAGA